MIWRQTAEADTGWERPDQIDTLAAGVHDHLGKVGSAVGLSGKASAMQRTRDIASQVSLEL